ncbi:helix-turn-helix transcriptional regulator [Pseudomonas sp. W2-17]|uniref:LexA family transcriptional regulator n=1 Tax=Pseudomonas sp. W2-17 TaxID=3058039 RepID=UPI0034E0697B
MTTEHSGDRLRLIAAKRDISFKKMAEELGVTPQVLNNWFKRGVPAREIQKALDTYHLRRDWLVAGDGLPDVEPYPWGDDPGFEAHQRKLEVREGLSNASFAGPIDVWDDDTPLDADEVYVPFLKEVELSAGSGRTVVEQSHRQKLRFGKLTLRRQNVQPSEAVCVTVSGNSMEPVLPHGSTVGVDQGSTAITDGKMYAINHGGQLRVKTLYRLPGGGVRMRSYNREEHPDEEYGPQEMIDKEIIILGKVFWSSVLW